MDQCWKLATAAFVWLVVTSVNGFAGDLSGTYGVEGNNPDGSAYTGSAVIAMGPESCRVNWTTGSSTSYGTCRLEGETFTVDFVLQGGTGVVVYQLERNGDMTGKWWMTGRERRVGREKLILRALASPSV